MNINQIQRVKKIMLRDLNKAIKRDARLIKRAERKVVLLQAKYDRLQMRLASRIQNDTIRIANI